MTLAATAQSPALHHCQIAERLILSMSAGAVNAGAYLACQRFVSHVTGTVTLIGVDFGSWPLVGEYALVLLCFLLGAISAVVMLALTAPTQYPTRSLQLVALLVALVAVMGHAGLFGTFGKSVEGPGDFVLLSLLSFAMGLLNATVAGSAAIGARVTHLTGHATELGMSLARAWLASGEERVRAMRHGGLLAGKILCFALGAAGMVILVRWGGYAAFLMAALLTLLGSVMGYIAHWQKAAGWKPEPSYTSASASLHPTEATIDAAAAASVGTLAYRRWLALDRQQGEKPGASS